MATVNYSFNLPTVGGDDDVWGDLLNANWSQLDSILDTLALKNITLAAGDGLTGGGNLGANRTFAVDGTVFRTSGGQSTTGIKTFTIGSATAPVVVERTNNNVNAVIEYKTTSGSVWAGQGFSGEFNIGTAGALSTGGDSVFRLDTSNGNLSIDGELSTSGIDIGPYELDAGSHDIRIRTPSGAMFIFRDDGEASTASTVLRRSTLGAATADLSAGAVGTYAFAWLNSTATAPAFGDTVSGSQLRPAGFTSGGGVERSTVNTRFRPDDFIFGSGGTNRSAFAGTWRCMGEAIRESGFASNYPHTLWLRIS